MSRLTRELVLPWAPQDLFELVTQVERYPEFLPWVKALRMESRQDDADGWLGVAVADVGWKAFTERFSTRVRADRTQLAVGVDLVRGPFRRLINAWRFQEVPAGSQVSFLIDYEFRNPLLQALATTQTHYASDRLIAAFEAEAARRYPMVGEALAT